MVDIESDDPRKAVIFNFSSSTPAAEIGAEPGQGLELPTNVREVSQSQRRPWLKELTSAFPLKTH